MPLSIRAFSPNPELHVPLGADAPLPDFSAATVDLEIGCGTGTFALAYAAKNSGRHLVAIEKTVTKFATFSRAYGKHSPINLTPVHADASLWVDRYVPAGSIERLFILYPNPYPKKKQENLRWHYMPGMQPILRALKPGASLVFCTNLRWLVDEAAEQFSDGWKLSFESLNTIAPGSREPLTLFEKKYLAKGQMCFDLRLRVPAPVNATHASTK